MADKTIVETFWRRVSETPDRTAIMHKVDGAYQSITWREHGETVETLSAALQSLGVKEHEHVGIMSGNRPHWTWCDFAILSSECVTVPVYPTLGPDEAAFVIHHSDCIGIFLANEHQLAKILETKEPCVEKLQFAVLMDGRSAATELKIYTWDEFLDLGREYLKEHKADVEQRRKNVEPDDLCTIVYTSGTTGVPKGAMLYHKHIFAVMEAMSPLIDFREDDLAISFLPLSHVYERVGGQFLCVYTGVPVAFAESMESVAVNLNEVKPTVLNAVPRFYEKAYARIQGQLKQMPPARKAFVRWAISIGVRATKQRMESKIDINILDKLYKAELRIAERLVFRKIRERFGGRLRLMTSGSAPLSNDVHLFFQAIGMPIVEGYGLTETCAPLSCNRPDDIKLRTVGKPLDGVHVKLAEDGELLVKGPTVFEGYYKNQAATDAAFVEDGWFRTGDIAKIDDEGYIQITDRKKDIIITSGGKHVAPQTIENLFKGEPMIANVIAYGDRRKYITALITLNPEALQKFAESNSIAYKSLDECTQNPKVRQEVEKLVHEKNQALARFQRIKKFVILDHELTIENNELTPTLKVKRKTVTEKYKDLLDGMYEQEDLEAQSDKSEESVGAEAQ